MRGIVYNVGRLEVELVEGDITQLEVGAIVNAANSWLKHGGGVAAAIVRRGGIEIQRESDEYVRKHGPLPVGGVAVTTAGKLKAKYVIHTVGPKHGDIDGDRKLYSAIKNSILKADELKLSDVALPAISTGVYGYPLERCAEIMVEAIRDVSVEISNLKRVVICLYGEDAYGVFRDVFNRHLGK